MQRKTLICPNCLKEFEPPSASYDDAYLTLDFAGLMFIADGKQIDLTPTEERLLHCLVANAGRTLRYKTLLSSVWGWEYIDDIDYLRIYVWHLRQKIEPDPSHPKYIITKVGSGYLFQPERSNAS